MCVVSMVMDHYGDEWGRRIREQPRKEFDIQDAIQRLMPQPPAITAEEIAEFRRLLERAREYDRRNNEPDCELDSKKQTLKDIAQALGVEISFL